MQNNSNNQQIQMRKQTSIITNNHYHTKRSPSPISLSPHKHTTHQKQKQHQQIKNSNISIVSPVKKLSLSNNNSAISGITNNQMTSESMSKIITMMRQQIQTSNNFYVNKMKKLLQDQAKEICALRDRIVQNQRDLIRKTNIIDQMKNSTQKQRDTTPKKKISVISSQQEQLNNQSMEQLSQKINQLQQKLTVLEQNMSQKHQSQKQMNKKVEQLEKGTIKYFANKLAGYQSKLDKYLIKKQQEIQKLYGDFKYYVKMGQDNGFFVNKNTGVQKSIVNNLSSTQNMTVISSSKNLLSNTTINKQSPIQNMGKKIIKLTNELQQLRGQLTQIKEKEYNYDNHQVQIIKENINKIRKYIDNHSCSNKEVIRNNARHSIQQPIQMNSQKIIRNQQPVQSNHQNINLIKSQKLITMQQQPYIPQQKQINSINSITNRQNLYSTPLNSQSSYLTSVIPQSTIQNSLNSKQKISHPAQNTKNISIYLNNPRQDMNDINTLNLSTPTVYHHQNGQSNYNTNYSTNPSISHKNASYVNGEPAKSYYISPNYNSNNSTKTVVKTINLTETSVSSYMNDHANTNKYKNTSNPTNTNNKHINLFKPFEEQPQNSRNIKQKTLQNQFYDQNSAQRTNKKQQHSQEQCQQQSIEYEQQQSSFNQYEEQQSQQLVQVNNIDRLINTIKDQRMPMPVYVEIDQTGYLKCIKNGMYLVDSNDDGFELLDEQVRELTNKSIIKLAANTVCNAINSSSHRGSCR